MFKWLKEWGEEVKNRFVAVVPGYFGGGWVTEGHLTDPTTGTMLADTGPLSAGIYNFTLMIVASTTISITKNEVQHRDAANNSSLLRMRFGTQNVVCTPVPINDYKIQDGERLRWIGLAAFTGSCQASILYTRVFPLIRGQ